MQSLGSLIQKRLQPKQTVTKLHTELHAFIAELRVEYGETKTKGAGSFGWYLGRFKKVPLTILYQLRAEVRQGVNVRSPVRLFHWKLKKYLAEQKERAKIKDGGASIQSS